MWKLATATVALAAALAGCASVDPYSFGYTELTDQAKVLHRPPPGSAMVVVRREPGFVGAGADHFFTINGEKIVELHQGDQFTFTMPPGRYIVGARCESPFPTQINEMPLQAEAGQTSIFRLYSSASQGCQIAAMSR